MPLYFCVVIASSLNSICRIQTLFLLPIGGELTKNPLPTLGVSHLCINFYKVTCCCCCMYSAVCNPVFLPPIQLPMLLKEEHNAFLNDAATRTRARNCGRGGERRARFTAQYMRAIAENLKFPCRHRPQHILPIEY